MRQHDHCPDPHSNSDSQAAGSVLPRLVRLVDPVRETVMALATESRRPVSCPGASVGTRGWTF